MIDELLEALGRSDLVVPTAGEERPFRRASTNRLLGVAYIALSDTRRAQSDCVATNRIAAAMAEALVAEDEYVDETERPLEDELW